MVSCPRVCPAAAPQLATHAVCASSEESLLLVMVPVAFHQESYPRSALCFSEGVV